MAYMKYLIGEKRNSTFRSKCNIKLHYKQWNVVFVICLQFLFVCQKCVRVAEMKSTSSNAKSKLSSFIITCVVTVLFVSLIVVLMTTYIPPYLSSGLKATKCKIS